MAWPTRWARGTSKDTCTRVRSRGEEISRWCAMPGKGSRSHRPSSLCSRHKAVPSCRADMSRWCCAGASLWRRIGNTKPFFTRAPPTGAAPSHPALSYGATRRESPALAAAATPRAVATRCPAGCDRCSRWWGDHTCPWPSPARLGASAGRRARRPPHPPPDPRTTGGNAHGALARAVRPSAPIAHDHQRDRKPAQSHASREAECQTVARWSDGPAVDRCGRPRSRQTHVQGGVVHGSEFCSAALP